MKLSINKINNSSKTTKILVFFCILAIFFPVRHVFLNSFAFKTGQYSDFTSFSLYLSDILVFLLFLHVVWPRGRELLPRGEDFHHVVKLIKPLFYWVFLIFLVHTAFNWPFNLYFFVKWLELLVTYGTLAVIFEETSIKVWFLKVFTAFASIESVIALWQFTAQQSIGLSKLGEQAISPNQTGFAKIIIHCITYVRGYGTFPHPNLLSAFLVVSILSVTWLLSTSKNKRHSIFYSIILLINTLGLAAAFSRAAFLAVVVGEITYFGGMIVKKRFDSTAKSSVLIVLVCAAAAALVFQPFLFSRVTISDSASEARILYGKTGLRMTEHNPIFGVGLGESVLHMQQYSTVHLDPWDIQPVHNYFLLAASELGIIGALILIWLFWKLFSELAKTIHQAGDSDYQILLLAIFLSVLVLMQFDHYFYTLEQTQLLLWMFLGLIAAEIKNPANKAGETVLKPNS